MKIKNFNKGIQIVLGILFIHTGTFAKSITISSIQELAQFATTSGNQVTMKPGVYKMQDYLSPQVIATAKTNLDAINRAAMITFSGNDNSFDLTGVTIEVNTELLNDFGKYIIEIYVAGNNINIKGLTLTDIGNSPTSKGGNSFTVSGENNKIENVTLNVSGSSPYGYGDLLGKGSNSLVDKLQKHSGMLIEGTKDSIIGCSIYSKSFGHCFYIQGGRDVYFQDCYAEAQIRTTDSMLAEKSGPAFDSNFESVYKNYAGKNVITPGYVKSLSECGFRTYGQGGREKRATGAVTAINCKAKNTRVGFAFSKVKEAILIKDCEALGCEAGYNISGVTIENSRGDAVNGPLLYVDADQASKVELFVIPTETKTIVHALACIGGNNHEVILKNYNNLPNNLILPILLGSTRPAGTNGYSPLGMAVTNAVTLYNYTNSPVELSSKVSACTIKSNGKVTDKGTRNTVVKID